MGRPRRGERRIDAAIDHLSDYGFPRPDIRRVINELLQLYGRDGWVFLEEGSYRVVLDKLMEEQQQEAQISEVHAQAESESAARPIESPAHEPRVPLPGLAATATVRPRLPCYGWISESDSDSESDDNGESAVEQPEPPAGPRHEVNVPTSGGGLLPRRKRPSGWDVRPANC